MDTERELQFGSGMRVQRLVEAGLLVTALLTQDERFAYATFVLSALQAISPRWVPIALVVARLAPFSGQHRIGDLYFDQRGVRGSSAIAVVVQSVGLGLVLAGWRVPGFLVLAFPAASLLMAPTLGFCAGCWFYVLARNVLVRRGWLRGVGHDPRDIPIDEADRREPQLHPAPER